MKKKMNVWRARAVAVLGVALLLALAAAALVYRSMWIRYDGALQQLEPRSERLEGVVDAGADIEALLTSASGTVAPLLHPSGESAQNDLQQQIR